MKTKDYVYLVLIAGMYFASQAWFDYRYYSGNVVLTINEVDKPIEIYNFPETTGGGGALVHVLADCGKVEKPRVLTITQDGKGFRRLSYCKSQVKTSEINQKLPDTQNSFR